MSKVCCNHMRTLFIQNLLVLIVAVLLTIFEVFFNQKNGDYFFSKDFFIILNFIIGLFTVSTLVYAYAYFREKREGE